jgi:DNA-binding transcriptional LysR family regulator
VTLTEPGRRLLERARVILEEMKLARATLAAEQG